MHAAVVAYFIKQRMLQYYDCAFNLAGSNRAFATQVMQFAKLPLPAQRKGFHIDYPNYAAKCKLD